MREAGGGQDVGQHRRDAGIGVGLVGDVLLRPVRGLAAEERGFPRPLAVAQGDEAQVVEFLLAAVGDGHLGGAEQLAGAGAGVVGIERQALDQAAAFHAADRRRPAIEREGMGDALGQGEGGIAPEEGGLVGHAHVFLEIQAFAGAATAPIGQAQQHVRQHQADVAGVLLAAEFAPAGEIDALEYLGQVARLAQLGVTVQAEQPGRGGGDERGMGGGRHLGDLLQAVEGLGIRPELVGAHQQAVGEAAVFRLVDHLEQGALVEFDCLLHVLEQVLAGGVEHAQLEHDAGFAARDEIEQAAPGGFQRLEGGRVHDLGELPAQGLVDLRHPLVDQHRRRALGDLLGAELTGFQGLHDLPGELADHGQRPLLLFFGIGGGRIHQQGKQSRGRRGRLRRIGGDGGLFPVRRFLGRVEGGDQSGTQGLGIGLGQFVEYLGQRVAGFGARLQAADHGARVIQGAGLGNAGDQTGRLEVIQALEHQVAGERRLGIDIARRVRQHVGDAGELHAGARGLQHVVEIVAVDVGHAAILEQRQWIFRIDLPGQVGEQADDEGDFLFLYGASGFHVVGDAYPWRPNARASSECFRTFDSLAH